MRTRLLFVLIACIGILSGTGCKSSSPRRKPRISIDLLTAPEWKGTRVAVNYAELGEKLGEVFEHFWQPKDIAYVAIPENVMHWAWVQVYYARRQAAEQVRWYLMKKYGLDQGPRKYEEWLETVNDCDDFSEQSASLCRWVIGIRYGIQHVAVPVDILHVVQETSWAGVGAGGAHAINWYYAIARDGTRGIKVLEPQNGIETWAKEYTNPVLFIGSRSK